MNFRYYVSKIEFKFLNNYLYKDGRRQAQQI
jgi:hypothetical protein